MYAHSPVFPTSVLTSSKTPPGALYTVHVADDPSRRQFSHPLLAPITGASLLMSFSAYNTSGIGVLSTVFSMITGTVGLWGLWTVRSIVSSYVAVSYTESIRSSSPALAGVRNLGQTNAPLPSSSATNLQRRRSRKARGRRGPNYGVPSQSTLVSHSQATGSRVI